MTTYERMAILLKSTGVYRMDGTTLIDAEMKAYGRQLDLLLGEADKLASSIYFDDPKNPRASEFERLFGLPVTPGSLEGVDLEVRRKKIAAMQKRLSIGNRSFGRTGMAAAIESFGLTVSCSEKANNSLTITVIENKEYLATPAEVEETLRNLVPCGTTLTVI